MPYSLYNVGSTEKGAEGLKTLVIIPAFNEQAAIVPFVEELKTVCPACDLIVINDCSRDETGALCRAHGYPTVNLPVNLGIGGAVQTGYLYALENDYDIAVQMDGDGQHDPRDLAALLAPIERGEADLAIGSRFVTGEGFQSTWLRRLGISILRGAVRLRTRHTVTDPTSGFRAANRRVIELFAHDYAQDYPEPESLVTALKSGARVCDVPAAMRARQGGASSISEWKSVYYMLKVTLAVLLHTPHAKL